MMPLEDKEDNLNRDNYHKKISTKEKKLLNKQKRKKTKRSTFQFFFAFVCSLKNNETFEIASRYFGNHFQPVIFTSKGKIVETFEIK